MGSLKASDVFKYLLSFEDNKYCVDCHRPRCVWATVSYGAFICFECSAVHRSLGVHISFVRSLTLDQWTQRELRLMLAGGNKKLREFFREQGLLATPPEEKYQAASLEVYREGVRDAADSAAITNMNLELRRPKPIKTAIAGPVPAGVSRIPRPPSEARSVRAGPMAFVDFGHTGHPHGDRHAPPMSVSAPTTPLSRPAPDPTTMPTPVHVTLAPLARAGPGTGRGAGAPASVSCFAPDHVGPGHAASAHAHAPGIMGAVSGAQSRPNEYKSRITGFGSVSGSASGSSPGSDSSPPSPGADAGMLCGASAFVTLLTRFSYGSSLAAASASEPLSAPPSRSTQAQQSGDHRHGPGAVPGRAHSSQGGSRAGVDISGQSWARELRRDDEDENPVVSSHAYSFPGSRNTARPSVRASVLLTPHSPEAARNGSAHCSPLAKSDESTARA